MIRNLRFECTLFLTCRIRSGVSVNANLAAIDQHLNTIVTQHAEVGSRDAQIQRVQPRGRNRNRRD